MNYVYLIQNDFDGKIYIGQTSDIKRRLNEHNNKGQKFTTRKNGKWIIIYLELFRSRKDAELREKKLKQHGGGKKELLKRLKYSLLEPKIGAGRSESFSGNCLPKTQLPANSQEDV